MHYARPQVQNRGCDMLRQQTLSRERESMGAKADIIYVILGVVVVILLALVIKPMAMGEIPRLPWGWGEEAGPTVTPAWVPTIPPATAPPTPAPTTAPPWNGTPQKIGFVDPSTYQIPTGESRVNMTALPVNRSAPTRWVTYATIDGYWSGTTGIVRIPGPIWRLDYSDIATSNYEISLFNCQVMDAADPNRFVRIITLDFRDFLAAKDNPNLRKEQWVSTFYEGYHDYYFVINARCIDSYHLKIQVPEEYLGV